MTSDDKTAPMAMTVPHQMREADCCWGGVDRDGQRVAVWLSEEDWRHYLFLSRSALSNNRSDTT